MCSALSRIVPVTHLAPTRMVTHHCAMHSSKFLCDRAVCNALTFHIFWYMVRTNTRYHYGFMILVPWMLENLNPEYCSMCFQFPYPVE